MILLVACKLLYKYTYIFIMVIILLLMMNMLHASVKNSVKI